MKKVIRWLIIIALVVAGIILLVVSLGRKGDLIEKANEIIKKSKEKEREIEEQYQQKLKKAEQKVESLDRQVAEKREEVWKRVEELEREGKIKTTEEITYEDAKEHLKRFLQS